MIAPTQDAVQVLLDRPRGEGMIVSCYADRIGAVGAPSRWALHLKNEAAAIDARLADDPSARARFARDLRRIQSALEGPAARGAHGMAIFSAAEQGFFRAFPLGVPVKDRLVLDEEPYLVPLLEAMHRQRRYLVVLTDSHRGRVYEAAWGHTHLLRSVEEDVPRRHRSAGELWGKQQATIARHRENHLLHYRKRLLSAIERSWLDGTFRGVILLGDHETVAALRTALPQPVTDRVVHTARCSWGGEPHLDAMVHAILEDALRAHDNRLVEEVTRRLREHHLVAAGPQEVINALRNGQVDYPGFLVLEPDHGEMATRCRECGSVFTTMAVTCSFCQGRCEKVNLWQEILFFAARHHITAHTIEGHPDLSRHGGVAAVLSRPDPWDVAPAGTAPETVGT